jgi:hypothetical protein
VFRWICFWRRKRLVRGEASGGDAEHSRQEPEEITVPAQGLQKPNSESKDAKVLIPYPSSNLAHEAPPTAHGQSETRPVLTMPVQQAKVSQVEIPTEAKRRDSGMAPADEIGGTALDSPGKGRAAYFARGCYAPSGLRTPRLVAPDLALRSVAGRASGKLADQASSQGASDRGSARPSTSQK